MKTAVEQSYSYNNYWEKTANCVYETEKLKYQKTNYNRLFPNRDYINICILRQKVPLDRLIKASLKEIHAY